MKKKLLILILTLIATISLAFGLAACGGGNSDSSATPPNTQQGGSENSNNSGNSGNSGSDNTGNDSEKDNEDENSEQNTPPVKYTVVFDANGGKFSNASNTYSVEVESGAKVSAPAQPTRDDFTFTNWYKDSGLTQIWNFESDIVTKAERLYAGWEAIIKEYNVAFVLNYEGAEDVTQSTVDGLITYIPTRSNYVFNGWWISDGLTENGEYILAQKWDTTEIVTESGLTLVAEWVEASTVSSQLNAPSVSINGNVFTWQSVSGADHYDLRVYKSNSSEELLKTNVNQTTWTFPDGYNAGYYNIKIRAIGDGVTTVNSSFVTKSYGHKILGGISKIDFDISTSVLTWTAVRNATRYELYINNNLVDTLTYTTYDMSDFEAGSYTIKIYACKDNYQSSTTTKSVEKKRLKIPSDIKLSYDGANVKAPYTLSWDTVLHADTYIINIGNQNIRVEDPQYSFADSANFWTNLNEIEFTIDAFDSNADYLISNSTVKHTLQKVNAEMSNFKFITTNDTCEITGITDKNVTSIVVPDYVTKISEGAFSGCTKLQEITLPFVGDSIKLTDDNYQYPLGYIFGTADYAGSTATGQSYYDPSTKKYTNTTFYIPTSLKTITITSGQLNYSFYKCANLENIILGDNISSVGSYTFSDCTSLESITVAANNENYSSQDGILYNKAKTEFIFIPKAIKGNITIPISISSIDKNTFSNCSKLESITVDADNENYSSQDGILYNKAKTEFIFIPKAIKGNVTIPQSMNAIGSSAFYDCTSLESITIGDSVTSIGGSAFSGCTSLESITIPDSVTSIGSSAFYSCTSLKTVYWNAKNCETAGDYNSPIFGNCTALTTVNIGENVEKIPSGAFSGCTSLESITVDANNENYLSQDGILYNKAKTEFIFIPKAIKGNVTIPQSMNAIRGSAFYNCTSLESITIPDSVTSIGYMAFRDCTSLESITISDSVTSIDNDAFYNCTNIKTATIPTSAISKIPKNNLQTVVITSGDSIKLFGDCTSLESITIGDSVTSIDSKAFYNCTSLESVNFGNDSKLKTIGRYAFYNCTSLESITIPANVTSIGERAFQDCTGLKTVYWNAKNCESAGRDYTIFYDCTALTTVYIGENVEKIPSDAFKYCTSLENVTISNSVTSIGSSAFYNCTSLESITIGNDSKLTSIGQSAFNSCTSLKSIKIPDSVTSIDYNAFIDCVNLTGVYITDIKAWCNIEFDNNGANPLFCAHNLYLNDNHVTNITSEMLQGITEIKDDSFYNCTSLESITIPNSVTSIGSYAFYHCTSLESVTFENQTGWKVSKNSNMSNAQDIDVSNTATNAQNLTYSNKYVGYYWHRYDEE